MNNIKIFNVGAIPGSKMFSIRLSKQTKLEDEIVFTVGEPSNGKSELQSTLAKSGVSIKDCIITPRDWNVSWD